MTNLEKICKEIIDAREKATPGPYWYDYGNGEIESQNKDYYRIGIAHRDDIIDRFAHREQFKIKASPIHPDEDMVFLTIAANQSAKIAQALLKTTEALNKFCTTTSLVNHQNCKIQNCPEKFAQITLAEVEELLK